MSDLKDHSILTNEETFRPAYASGYPHISYGLPFQSACRKHVGTTFKADRVYIIASGSLSRQTQHVQLLQEALGEKVVGVRHGMKPHTLWSEILDIAQEANRLHADLLITLGAGSLTDGAKIIATAMANNAASFADLDRLHSGDDWTKQRDDINKPKVPIIAVPTSLSGGEYSFLGGGTNDRNHMKYGFGHPTVGPALIVLDPKLTTTTPDSVWLQSGVRAVDHCVEGLCSLQSTVASDDAASAGLHLLIPGLLKCKADKQDLVARHSCQMGVIEAMKVVFQCGVPMGASHGIGHQLGPLGVGHGETSCILLPAVCKYNISANPEQQQKVRDILWQHEEAARLFQAKGATRAGSDLGDLLDTFITALGMPRTLEEVGIGADKLDLLAQNSLHDRWVGTNPRPLTEKSQVMEILAAVNKKHQA